MFLKTLFFYYINAIFPANFLELRGVYMEKKYPGRWAIPVGGIFFSVCLHETF